MYALAITSKKDQKTKANFMDSWDFSKRVDTNTNLKWNHSSVFSHGSF